MALSINRRTVLAAGAGVAAGVALPAGAQAGGHSSTTVGFVLNAHTLDGGEQVTSLTLDTSRLGRISPSSLTTATFSVHVKATSPIPITPDPGYDLDRVVTAARVDRHGDIVLELSTAEGQPGGGTLGYLFTKGRNVQLNLAYTITQNTPLIARGRPITITKFRQGRLSNPEVDAYSYHESSAGMKYRLFRPDHRGGKRPLIVWLHGGGEGASLPDNYYDNETTLRANRGALGFSTREAQKIFNGAYVVAPQSFSAWMQDGPRFAPLIQQIVDDVARRHAVDRDRIHVVGCSNGGYMSMKMTTVYPRTYASSVPICGVVAGNPPLIPDAELTAITTPTWLVTSLDDTTVNPQANTVHAHDLIPRSRMTLYDNVIWNGHQFPGHWSWIYVARNDPKIAGTPIWQWMSRQRR
ncbi:prolyl oligopeptidase family serine peptidase [Actinoplanes sp. TRM 88003]|uniref:Prolyl oligopeptidase family serine peptidase n=1 Tax=Paractinoplanes aksuensis TaxID=2939490 RepID=A0ABT1DS94_9ACTN|nr:prolyl oligopeptidase family serine peptidase [Actinoplanes aksuensis]MCO8273714.1 prolyl oligopeptidase family serine peptidase [Actinoplanes aksuensis]